MSPLAAWVLAASSLVTDPDHHRLRPIAVDGAVAMADGCTKTPLYSGDDGRRCGTILLIMAGRESNYTLDIEGDGGHAFGPFQTHYPQPYTPAQVKSSWPIAVEIALKQLRHSGKVCPAFPLAPYARGFCSSVDGRAISVARTTEASRVLALAPEIGGPS